MFFVLFFFFIRWNETLSGVFRINLLSYYLGIPTVSWRQARYNYLGIPTVSWRQARYNYLGIPTVSWRQARGIPTSVYLLSPGGKRALPKSLEQDFFILLSSSSLQFLKDLEKQKRSSFRGRFHIHLKFGLMNKLYKERNVLMSWR